MKTIESAKATITTALSVAICTLMLTLPTLAGAAGPPINPLQVALLKWSPNAATTFTVAGGSNLVAFDGANVWMANSSGVTKLRVNDGANLGTFPAGPGAFGVLFDGANIWTANQAGNNVTKLRASDGVTLGTFPVGTYAIGLAFDGANIWVANLQDNTVTKLRASDGANLGTFSVGSSPNGVAFDGVNIWVNIKAVIMSARYGPVMAQFWARFPPAVFPVISPLMALISG